MLTVVRTEIGEEIGAAADALPLDLAERMRFLEFDNDDIERLVGINDLARRYADSVIDEFYRHLLKFEDTAAYFDDQQTLERVKNLQRQYFLELTQGSYDAAYAANRTRIGAVHERIGLPIKSYLGMYNFYLRAVAGWLAEAYADTPQQVLQIFLSLMKLTFLDIGLAIDTYIASRESTIRQQRAVLQELPTPVLPLREGLLIVPIIGMIDSRRARQLTEQLLDAIRNERARVVVIDITGVTTVDSQVANHLVQTIEAARLMGARVILAGISPEIAQTMVRLGIDLNRVATVGNLQTALERADHLQGYVVSREGGATVG
jgi:rsbT co-antagonist protein RsbR